jgi:glutamate/tyrosine decarboxylase-like PLP-dependent enzyme
MENEIVRQIGNLFKAEKKIYGNLTSGGTESIFLSLLSAREWSLKNRSISNPEVILSTTAHPAFLKAIKFLKIKPVVIPATKSFNLDIDKFTSAINDNTILLVGSAPAYPYGMIDPISHLSELAIKNNLLLHVDACIGGFLLSYLKKLDYNIPSFDFSLEGVTSISVDLHKYAYAPKGSSVLLYENSELRKSQFSVYSNWEGGIYASTSFMGTKPGGIVASSWTALNHIGEDGYLELTKKTMNATSLIKEFILNNQDLSLIGESQMSLIAFKSDTIDIYQLADKLNDLGWYIGRLQNPSGIHLVVSQIHADGAAKQFVIDLEVLINQLKKKNIKNGVEKIIDKGAAKILNLMPFNKLRQTLVKAAGKDKQTTNKKRIIYNVKEELDLDESNELFRSIMDGFYS